MTAMKKFWAVYPTWAFVICGFLIGVSLRDFIRQFEKSNEKIETNLRKFVDNSSAADAVHKNHALLENDFINSDNKWKVQMHYKDIQQKQLSKGGFL